MLKCPHCRSSSKKRSTRAYSATSKLAYSVCVNDQCQCVFTTFETFERFITKTVDPAHLPAPVEELINAPRPVTPAYAVRLE
ncbi:ogr/Delta-like zinc finger family protein [Rahnella inusitata]|uniref:Transcriptional regulator n=1 Tax=Rahnella inusitata TaxID=58169 RepID=A0ABX9P3U1_9GAMM|nr:transcriptional regulator [Rahnella inusitata]